MLIVKSPWVFGILIAVSCSYALPSNISPRLPDTSPPSNHTLGPISSLINITSAISYNTTKAECVGGVGLKIAKFFLFNYIGHAFTVKPGTGYKTTYMITFAIAAIFLPYYGLLLACRGMETCSIRMNHTLKRAGRGGALCVVARTKNWRPKPGDKAWCWRTAGEGSKPGDQIPAKVVSYQGLELEYLSQKYVQIHGMCHFPDGGEYMLARLPTDYDVDWEEVKVGGLALDIKDGESSICSNYSLVRPMIALFQLLSAVPVIYEAHSEESRASHGYAGYQLTVIPFALMSIINTFQTMVTPSYGASYMVRSEVMDEAEKRGAVFQGVVGMVHESVGEISLDGPVEGYGEIIGEIGTFKTLGDEQNRVPEREISCSRNNDNIPAQSPPTSPEGDARVVAESSPVASHEITAEPIATGGNSQNNGPICVIFQDKTVLRYPDTKAGGKEERTFFNDTRKTIGFIFRQQIWESLREEFPVIRWFLKPHGLTKMPSSEIPALQNQADKRNHKREISGAPHSDEPQAPQRRETNDEPQSKDEIRNLLKIARVNPQRTCIARIFNRASKKAPKGGAMILVPAIGHPRTRGKYKREVFMYYFSDILFVLSFAAPYLITFALTRYDKGQSSMFQRVIVVLWLVMMQVACIPQRIVWNFLQTRLVPLGSKMLDRGIIFVIVSGILWSVPGIIGFVNVLRMMVDDNRDRCDGAFGHLADLSGFGPGAK